MKQTKISKAKFILLDKIFSNWPFHKPFLKGLINSAKGWDISFDKGVINISYKFCDNMIDQIPKEYLSKVNCIIWYALRVYIEELDTKCFLDKKFDGRLKSMIKNSLIEAEKEVIRKGGRCIKDQLRFWFGLSNI